MKNINVYIIHGFMASPSHHWFPWLASELEQQGVSVKILDMPDASNPDPIAWQDTLDNELTLISEETFIVAHSLGCIAVLDNLQKRLLKQGTHQRLGGTLLVSGFVEPLPILPQLNNFLEHPIDYKALREHLGKIAMIGSPHDEIVPYGHTEKLAQALGSSLYSIDHAGHFLADDGFTSFPALLAFLRKMMGV